MDKTIHYKRRKPFYGLNWLLISLFVLYFGSCISENKAIRIIFVGDILLSRNVQQEITTRNTFPWENLSSVFESSDLIIGNLEGAIYDPKSTIKSEYTSPKFSIDSNNIGLLQKAGFSALTIENNRILDFGKGGRIKTIEALIKNDLVPISLENSPQFFNIHGKCISIIAINKIPYSQNTNTSKLNTEFIQKIQLANILSDLTIISVHWGSELLEWPDNQQRKFAKWLIKNGADIIIGSHPHLIQKPEMIDGKPVFFSLGNHLFDQKYNATKTGLMVELIIDGDEIEVNGIQTKLNQGSFYPIFDKNIDLNIQTTYIKNKPLIINDYLIKPLSINDIFISKTILKGYKNEKERWKSHPMTLVSVSEFCPKKGKDYLFTLEKYYSDIDHENNVRPYVYQIDQSGIIAKWRGSALSWPLINASISQKDKSILCALHRADSFINLNKNEKKTRLSVYKWNGFGFDVLSDSVVCKYCDQLD